MKKVMGLLTGVLVIASCTTNPKSEVREPQQVGTGGVGSLSAEAAHPEMHRSEISGSEVPNSERSLEKLDCRIHFKDALQEGLSERTARVLKRKYGVKVVYGESEANVGIMLGIKLVAGKEYEVDRGPYPGYQTSHETYKKLNVLFFKDKKLVHKQAFESFDPKDLAQEIVNVMNCSTK